MYTVITGPPGTGKTSRLLQVSCSTRLKLLHNIDCLKSGDHVFHDSPLSFRDVSDYFRIETYDKNSLYHDSVFLIDEAQSFFRDFPLETDITGFIENHCAYDVDIYVALQDIRFINPAFLPDEYRHELYYRSVSSPNPRVVSINVKDRIWKFS